MSGRRVYDPSKLHLKKELTQIKKSAKALRDPGTSSSLRSPLTATRSATTALLAQKSTSKLKKSPFSVTCKEKEREKEKRSVLYNWRGSNKKSSSEKSLPGVDLDGGNHNNDGVDGSSSNSARLDDCLSDARNGGCAGDSKINSYVDDILNGNAHLYGRPPRVNHGHAHHTMRFRCGGTKLASIGSPSIARRANGKMKFRKTVNSCSMQKRRRKRLKEVVLDRKSLNSKLALKGVAPSSSLGLSQDDSVSLIDQFNDTKEWYNSEELCNSSTTSPLLSRLMQKKNLPQSSKKLLSGIRRGDSSYTYSTPALSTTSFNRYFNYINPMSNGSWDATTVSLNGGDDDEAADPLDLPARQGCGIPCYWSRRSTPKYRGSYGVCSPSISDTLLRRKGNHRQYGSLSGMSKQRIVSGATQSRLPLLNSYDGGASSFGTGKSDDELTMNLVELDLEGMSRLDGRQWSFGCSSQEGLELALAGDSQDESTLENVRSLSWKYRPMFFDELVGQTIVVQSLTNALTRGRIAPVYLFQGPRGTGKTITAKIFAAALNCMATEGTKPCGICKKCSNSISCRSRDIMEVSGSNKKGIDSVRYVLKKLAVAPPSAISSYKVFVIDECHLLPSKTWAGLLKFIEDQLQQVVFIFITTDLDNIPRVILSRCQKHLFNKIKDVEIVSRLQRIATEENMDIEPHALELISVNADGSIRDAETMLEQLSLLGKRITATLVNELVGVVSDEKLIELLELAISSNTAETVKKARELLDSGADPLALMSQLATLIMDIIAGNYLLDGDKCSSSLYGGRMTEEELDKFKNALKLLSEAEKQLRVCSERSTWFTATLLQLGSFTSPDFSLSGSSRRQSSKTTEEDQSTPSRSTSHGNAVHQQPPLLLNHGINSNSSVETLSSPYDVAEAQIVLSKSDMEKLDHLWLQCIEKCHYEKLRQLLQTYGKLISLSEVNGVLLAYIAFKDGNIKARAERYVISITNTLETVLRRSVEVRIVVLPDGLIPIASRDTKEEKTVTLPVASEGNDQVRGTKVPMQRIESIIREQRLETAWLQAVEKGGPLSINRSRPERNQVLPQDQVKSSSMDSELNKDSKVSDKKDVVKDLMGIRAEHQPLSPSLLHQSKCPGGSLDKECQGYESGSGSKGCNILFCCYNKRSRTGKVKQGIPFRHHKGGQFLCFGECWSFLAEASLKQLCYVKMRYSCTLSLADGGVELIDLQLPSKLMSLNSVSSQQAADPSVMNTGCLRCSTIETSSVTSRPSLDKIKYNALLAQQLHATNHL
ncbi:hypothetical protein V2J09_018211 [Rumex salicifolius]